MLYINMSNKAAYNSLGRVAQPQPHYTIYLGHCLGRFQPYLKISRIIALQDVKMRSDPSLQSEWRQEGYSQDAV